MTQLQTLIEEIPKYQPAADLDLLERAYRFSERSHQGQQRASGEPYLSHPLEVAGLLVNFKMDVTTVTAGLLHDVLGLRKVAGVGVELHGQRREMGRVELREPVRVPVV